jgi:hypothetical protein
MALSSANGMGDSFVKQAESGRIPQGLSRYSRFVLFSRKLSRIGFTLLRSFHVSLTATGAASIDPASFTSEPVLSRITSAALVSVF